MKCKTWSCGLPWDSKFGLIRKWLRVKAGHRDAVRGQPVRAGKQARWKGGLTMVNRTHTSTTSQWPNTCPWNQVWTPASTWHPLLGRTGLLGVVVAVGALKVERSGKSSGGWLQPTPQGLTPGPPSSQKPSGCSVIGRVWTPWFWLRR